MPEVSERTLWLALPLALVATAYFASTLIEQLRNATTSPPSEETPTAKKVDDDAEEHIPVETLRVLSDGYSFELRTAAFKIALKQSLKDGPKALLLQDLAGKDSAKRDQAVMALYFLIHGPDEYDSEFSRPLKHQLSHFQNLPTYRAIVTALAHLLPTHSNTPTPLSYSHANHPPSPIRPFFRTATETTLLKILLELLRRAVTATMPPEGSIETFLKAGLVKRWLANYPFPCALPMYSKLNYKRADVTSLLDNVQNRFDDPLMVDIFMLLTTSTAAERELQAVGLAHRSSRLRERFVHGDGDGDGFDVSRYSDAGWQTILPTRSDRNGIDLPRRRSSEERTVEDERVRRRHREAMVMADPDRPVSGRDILQRIDSGGPVRRGESLDIFEGILPLRPPRREHGSFQLFEDDGEEQEEMASMMSFSEVEDGASTADSMPSLRSVDEERQAEYERARREELETRLGARMVAAEESGVGGTRSTAALDIIGNTLERALQARERSRAASGMEGASGNGGRSAP